MRALAAQCLAYPLSASVGLCAQKAAIAKHRAKLEAKKRAKASGTGAGAGASTTQDHQAEEAKLGDPFALLANAMDNGCT